MVNYAIYKLLTGLLPSAAAGNRDGGMSTNGEDITNALTYVRFGIGIGIGIGIHVTIL